MDRVGELKETHDDSSSAQEAESSQPGGRPGSTFGQCQLGPNQVVEGIV